MVRTWLVLWEIVWEGVRNRSSLFIASGNILYYPIIMEMWSMEPRAAVVSLNQQRTKANRAYIYIRVVGTADGVFFTKW